MKRKMTLSLMLSVSLLLSLMGFAATAQDTSAPVTLAPDEAVSADVTQGGFGGVRLEAALRGYTGATHVNAGVLQIINSDGSVAVFFDIFPEVSF